MDGVDVNQIVQQLSVGFGALQDEYQKLYTQHQMLEKKLATAREQYNELARLYSSGETATPPLSLSSSPGPQKSDPRAPTSAFRILERSADEESRSASGKVASAAIAAKLLRHGLVPSSDRTSHGVRIWAGPSADKPETGSSMMPSISESLLEQDFTIEGKPSKLGCPFASMHKKKLSSHAASILSRYNQTGSTGAASIPLSTVSRVNGRGSLSRRSSTRGSFVDPIKAEICGLSGHNSLSPPPDTSMAKNAAEGQDPAEPGVCPIRFLDQHSPEEVATYFEKHKHEIPRSHEVCVMRYQSNEEQIKELDAKYGNLVSMIAGLGEKHKDMLPREPDDKEGDDPEDGLSNEKVRKWASSVSAQAAGAAIDDVEVEATNEPEEDRQPHFERPLRDIRVGESPSRPWGISVPAKYLKEAASETSSKPAVPAHVPSPKMNSSEQRPQPKIDAMPKTSGKCPFGHAGGSKPPGHSAPRIVVPPEAHEPKAVPKPSPETGTMPEISTAKPPQMVFTGPVFIGYSPEDAAKILRECGFRSNA